MPFIISEVFLGPAFILGYFRAPIRFTSLKYNSITVFKYED
jgi:hypothetical protein